MAEMTLFELAEVARVLNLSNSTVKNWTIGRPLTIKPSIRALRGKGSRNLYSREDVNVMALAAQLSRDGFTLKAVQQVLKELKGRSSLLGSHYATLVISSPQGKLEVKFLTAGKLTLSIHEHLNQDVVARYVLNLQKLVSSVEKRIEEDAETPIQRKS